MIVSRKLSGNSGEKINLSLQELPARNGFYISYNGKTLLSRIDPVAQGERLASGISVKERTIYFCPSPLYGYGLSQLLQKLHSSSVVLCAEADEKLFEISKKAFEKLNLQSLELIRCTDGDNLCAFVRKTWGERAFRRVEVVRLSGGWQLFPRLYEELAQALRRELALEWGNAITMIHLGRLYARNLIRNLALLPKSENSGALNFFSAPVLVLGAGPSLDKLLEQFSFFWKGKIPAPEDRHFKIICVDTCLSALNERSIMPDFVVILESQHWNLRDFIGGRGLEIDAIMDLSSLPASTRVLEGRRYLFATPWTELGLFKRLDEAGLLPETFTPLGSVGLSAVALALRMGSGTVLTGGIDFSYTMDAYHARSTPGYCDRQRIQNRFRSIINAAPVFREGTFSAVSKTGRQVRSDPSMRNYLNLFAEEFGENQRLLDIDGTGLPLGVKTVSLAEAFAILNEAGKAAPSAPRPQDNNPGADMEKTAAFIRGEINTLKALKDMLTGRKQPGEGYSLEELLDAADYLWAHFPECAGAGTRPPGTDLSFLKRVRVEIDPFEKLWYLTLEELVKPECRR